MFATFDYTIPFAQAITMIQEAGFEVVSIAGKGSIYATAEGSSEMTKLIEASGHGGMRSRICWRHR